MTELQIPGSTQPGSVPQSGSVQVAATISEQWSWASSNARIPQLSNVVVAVSAPVPHALIEVTVSDGEVPYGSAVVYEGPIDSRILRVGSVHVPLSATTMAQVEERRAAECVVTVSDGDGTVLARVRRSVEIQPRDLWLWEADLERDRSRKAMVRRHHELTTRLETVPDHPAANEIQSEIDVLCRSLDSAAHRGDDLSGSLLATFVRPNHPDVALVAREAADQLETATGDSSFFAFQIHDLAAAERRADSSVDAIYRALEARRISYSEPPPGWDYRTQGQRIREHGVVARAGLGTCMDTTVLMAAVIEHAGLLPVLVLVPEHIFVGYWRRNPHSGLRGAEWYPDVPVVFDESTISTLVEGGFLGLIETTVFTVGNEVPPGRARVSAREALRAAVEDSDATLIDVVAARRAGVAPLPAVTQRADGVTEVVEYRAGGLPRVLPPAPVDEPDTVVGRRMVDDHPSRYRTWKASLFSLNATNALLNLRNGPSVQPVLVQDGALGELEDRLNQDAEFSLLHGDDLPEIYRAQGIERAGDLGVAEQSAFLREGKLFVERNSTATSSPGRVSRAKLTSELRLMARRAKEAHDERGMNPLFLCLGLLKWSHKAGQMAEAPLILVPVKIVARSGKGKFALTIDTAARTTPNAALLEWLRREHELSIPGLAEPSTDKAGIDVDTVLSEVRAAVAQRGLPFGVIAEARLALLDLTSFRMWQDLHRHGDEFLERPLVKHLVHTPVERFADPAIGSGDARQEEVERDLETLETPVPADATQKRAVLWARQGRTFVLQGPPGTGKSQTITNMVAECLLAGQRVLFVAEKGTALSVVQRRLDAVGLTPFALNLHHEGSSAAEVRAQLKRSLGTRVSPDQAAMLDARRRLKSSRHELGEYPRKLHSKNAVGLSAYSAHDELLVLGSGPTMGIPLEIVAHRPELAARLRGVFDDLPRLATAAGVRPGHPWRLVGRAPEGSRDVITLTTAVRDVLEGAAWSRTVPGALRDVLDAVTHPTQLATLAAATDPRLPRDRELVALLEPSWPETAELAVVGCENTVASWAVHLHGFQADVLALDLRAVLSALEGATASGVLGRSKRQAAALEPLRSFAPAGAVLDAPTTGPVLQDLLKVQDTTRWIVDLLAQTPGLSPGGWVNPFADGFLHGVRRRLDELVSATSPLRADTPWGSYVRTLAVGGVLAGYRRALVAYAEAWSRAWQVLGVTDADFEVWRGGADLSQAIHRCAEDWRRHTELERLLPLQRWMELVQALGPLDDAGMTEVRAQLLDGGLAAEDAEAAFERGLAQVSETERVRAEGLDRFDSGAHDRRVVAYADAEARVRTQWVTSGPAHLLAARGGDGAGSKTGGLARELEKTRNRLGTRAILHRYGPAVQELTPLVLASPSSAVDLIEPGVMEFDLVIFDEASQITVPDAVGAIGRARAVVVVGDSKQMPPSRRVGSQPISEDEIDDPGADEPVEDQESILSECELARVPTLKLSWHYRSQDEALIAFSNGAYYEGDLSSFPTPSLLSSETGVELVRVEGRFIRANSPDVREPAPGVTAGKGTNADEALAIVAKVRELLAGPKKPTIGIVTFNEQQSQLVEDLLRATGDPNVRAAMDEASIGASEVLFVKALERVQGDERDVVLFSVAFSKQANGKIPLTFGPLSNPGGERRLNVAVTRARRKNIVFCSFAPEELDADSASYLGVKDLKRFLLFAQASGGHGGGAAPGLGRASVRDRHRDEVAEVLRSHGLHVMTDVGLSDFRLDLVIARPERPDRVLLPVLLDGESWRMRSTVADRDVLPVEVLKNLMGWPAVARVWWPMWLQNRQEVVDRILAEVDAVEHAQPADELAPERPGVAGAEDGQHRPGAQDEAAAVDEVAAVPVRSAPSQGFAGAVVVDAADVAHSSLGSAPSIPRAADDADGEPAPVLAPEGGSRREPIDAGTWVFVPAHCDVVGERDVLDALPGRAAAAVVRAQLLDVIDDEGPVAIERLVRIVARRFDLSTVRASRAAEIARLVPRAQVRRSKLGVFAWPTEIDPDSWTGFRRADVEGTRGLDEIAPQEIRNAMVAAVREAHGLSDEDTLRETARVFGVGRLASKVRPRLEDVLDAAVREGRLVERDGLVQVD